MSDHIFDISAKIIESGTFSSADSGPINRITQQLSELGNDMAVVESFSHTVIFRSGGKLVCFDASGVRSGEDVVKAIRNWTNDPIDTLVYTHGHMDHVGGSPHFLADSKKGGYPMQIVGHEAVPERMRRYDMTDGYNMYANMRQFAGFTAMGYGIGAQDQGVPKFIPTETVFPNRTYTDTTSFLVGDLEIQLTHAKGETDDHTWAWIPSHKAICAGDFFIWNFPNCGNPQKAQRYPKEWAAALRDMIAKEPEYLLPAHGLGIQGKDRVKKVLNDVATVLETVVAQTLEMMNQGATLGDIIHTVKVDQAELDKPWLKPLYDEPEFVVRNLWRLYGGWYEGAPDQLKPAPIESLSKEICDLLGGTDSLINRANQLAEAGDFRLACHLIELAAKSSNDVGVHKARAEIYQNRREGETSLMAKGIFGSAANESREIAGSQS